MLFPCPVYLQSCNVCSLYPRFDEIEKKIVPFLKTCGYNTKKGKFDDLMTCFSDIHGRNKK